MFVNMKLPEYEMEVVLDALKKTATYYGTARVTAFMDGDTKGYLEYAEKKSLAWQAYSHFKQALENRREAENE